MNTREYRDLLLTRIEATIIHCEENFGEYEMAEEPVYKLEKYLKGVKTKLEKTSEESEIQRLETNLHKYVYDLIDDTCSEDDYDLCSDGEDFINGFLHSLGMRQLSYQKVDLLVRIKVKEGGRTPDLETLFNEEEFNIDGHDLTVLAADESW
jgi:hypothetical protein